MNISNYDVIYSRDIIERIEELGEELADKLNKATNSEDWNPDNLSEGNYQFMVNTLSSDDQDDIEEYWELVTLAKEASQYSLDWEYGETLIRYSYFEDYCQEMLEDCGDIPQDLPWYIEVDWEKTAQNILQDYTEIDFGGVTYYIRSC